MKNNPWNKKLHKELEAKYVETLAKCDELRYEIKDLQKELRDATEFCEDLLEQIKQFEPNEK